VVLAAGDKRSLLVAPGVAQSGAAEPREEAGDPESSAGWSPWRTAGIVVGAVGVAALGIGIGFGIVAINKKDEAELHCDEANTCDDEGIALQKDGLTAAHVSTGMFIGGGVLVAAGLTMFLVASLVGSSMHRAPKVVVALLAGMLCGLGCDLIIGLEEGTPRSSGGIGGQGPTCDLAACPGSDQDCRVRACDADGQCTFANAMAGATCDDSGGLVCDGMGECVECASAADCPTPAEPDCIANQCVPAHCSNGAPDEGETDVDCGGECPPCINGQSCNGAADCVSGYCANNVCQPCASDTNCLAGEYCNAGVCTPKKLPGHNCTNPIECGTGNCVDGVCCDAPSCTTCNACNTSGAPGTCAAQNDGTACNDGTFCNGADTCGAGSCQHHAGNPCPGPNGDGNCSETCNEGGDACNGADPDGSACNDGSFCTGSDTCAAGSCQIHTGNPCPGPNGDGNCSESCSDLTSDCTGPDPDFSSCYAGGCGGDYCYGGVCQYTGCW
jgi:hypothetical protein